MEAGPHSSDHAQSAQNSLLEFAAQHKLKMSGLPEAARKAERQRQLAEAQAKRVARLEQQVELVREWAAAVDARPLRDPRICSETDSCVKVEFTWASHDERHEASLSKAGSTSRKVTNPSHIRLLEVQKDVMTRLLGDTTLHCEHWSNISWLKWPTWFREHMSRQEQARGPIKPVPQPVASWTDLESDSDWEDYHDPFDEIDFENILMNDYDDRPQPHTQIATREQCEFSDAIKSYYSGLMEVERISCFGAANIRLSAISDSPIPGFSARLVVELPRPSVRLQMIRCTQHMLVQTFAAHRNSLLERAAGGIHFAATVAMRSSKKSLWPALHKHICSFLPMPAEVAKCVQAIDEFYRQQAESCKVQAEKLSARTVAGAAL